MFLATHFGTRHSHLIDLITFLIYANILLLTRNLSKAVLQPFLVEQAGMKDAYKAMKFLMPTPGLDY